MREIKYRGYSREDEKWYYGFVHNSVGCLNGKQSEHYFIRPIEKIDHILEYTISYEIDKDSIGQYTGFKDKNGVEIYEGDIVKYETHDGRETYIKQVAVCFDEELGMWTVHAEEVNLYFINSRCEVIGNTYEEKLKESK